MKPIRHLLPDSRHRGLILAVVCSVVLSIATVEAEDSTANAERRDTNAVVAKLAIGKSTLEDVIRILGVPDTYRWGNEAYTHDNLPGVFIAVYKRQPSVVMLNGLVDEIRFEDESDYRFQGQIGIGTPLDRVLELLGEPEKTVIGEPVGREDKVLHRDVNGRKGVGYYVRRDQGVRLFFREDRVTAIYLTGPQESGSGRAVGPAKTLKAFDDVRDRDLSQLNLAAKGELLPTLNFNRKTVWPSADRMPARFDPAQLLESAKNPGLGIRAIHKRGITGEGVNVAIIDQPLLPDHPEYKGKIVAYHDTGCGFKDSMHGPAVASLLVGEECGTAPGARLYYAAAPSWLADAKFYAVALDWIVAQNASLPAGEKIRVVSVSAAPSGPGSPFKKNTAMWDEACRRAAEANILVIDCSRSPRGFILPCFLDAKQPESPGACKPGFSSQTEGILSRLSGKSRWAFAAKTDSIFVPVAPRSPAELYEHAAPSYQYNGQGGLSWAIPYAAGVLALGWEVRQDLSPDAIKHLLISSAHLNAQGLRIITPAAFLQAVEDAPSAAKE